MAREQMTPILPSLQEIKKEWKIVQMGRGEPIWDLLLLCKFPDFTDYLLQCTAL